MAARFTRAIAALWSEYRNGVVGVPCSREVFGGGVHVCLAIDRGGSPLIERSQHFVLTRFNVNIGPHRRTWDDTWLASRFRLFEEYCLPSMRSQTSQQFTWLVFFATSSRATIERYLADLPPMPNLQPVFTDSVFGPATTRDAVVSRHNGVSDRLITTRLDCDDALRIGLRRAFAGGANRNNRARS